MKLNEHVKFSFLVGLALAFLPTQAHADLYEEVAIEDSIIASGAPDKMMELRKHSNTGGQEQGNLLFNTWDTGDPAITGYVYPTREDANASQEYMIFKFDFFNVPAGATITSVGDFGWTIWYTHSTDASGTPFPNVSQETLGLFEFYEITAGDPNWEDNQFADGTVSPGSVTWNNLGGTFTKLPMVTEVDTGEGGPLIAEKLISNGDWVSRQQITGILIATLERLRSGQSVGLAMGTILGEQNNFSIHASETFRGDTDAPTLYFDFTTDQVFDPADFNTDGFVDGTDLGIWETAFGTDANGDADGDGDSDGADMLIWQRNFTGPAALAVASAVPEPATVWLIGVAGLALLGIQRRPKYYCV